MDIEILKSILKISSDKHDTLMYFLSDDIKERVELLPLLVDDKIYLNDKIYCIGKNNLDLEYTGNVKHIDDRLMIKHNGLSVYIDPTRYYIFVEPNQTRKSDRQFYESLLKSLG